MCTVNLQNYLVDDFWHRHDLQRATEVLCLVRAQFPFLTLSCTLPSAQMATRASWSPLSACGSKELSQGDHSAIHACRVAAETWLLSHTSSADFLSAPQHTLEAREVVIAFSSMPNPHFIDCITSRLRQASLTRLTGSSGGARLSCTVGRASCVANVLTHTRDG